MREEADRDNLDYEKKLHEEYGEWERHSKVVRERFLETCTGTGKNEYRDRDNMDAWWNESRRNCRIRACT